VKAVLEGGPWQGIVDVVPQEDLPIFTVSIIHSWCACDFCKPLGVTHVEHVYERNDLDVFNYRESKIPERLA
jgi:hypothetical protein